MTNVPDPVSARSPLEILADQEHGVGDIVYHRAQSLPQSGIVTGILIRMQGIIYLVVWGQDLAERYHFPIELCREPQPKVTGG
jgi:hypothetical protein